jgi:hypothetical protein
MTLRQITAENGIRPADVYMLIRQAAVTMEGNNQTQIRAVKILNHQ